MHSYSMQRLVTLLAVAAVPVLAGNAPAAERRNDVLPVPSAMARSCQQTLAERTILEFDRSPLSDCVRFLADFHQIGIQLDEHALEDAGIATDLPLTLHLTDVRLKDALKLMLEPRGLAYYVIDDSLVITSREAAEQRLFLRTYPIGDLAATHGEMEALVEVIRIGTGDDGWEHHTPNRKIISVPAVKALVVWQCYDMHERLRDVLLSLRQAKEIAEGQAWPAEQFPPAADTDAHAKIRKSAGAK